MHCILNVRISLYKTHTEKVQYKTQRLFEWRVFRKSPSRGISLTSRAPWVAVSSHALLPLLPACHAQWS